MSLLALPLLAAACADAPDAVLAPPERALSPTGGRPIVTHTTALIEHTVVRPCSGEVVDLAGRLHLTMLTRLIGHHRYEVTYAVQAPHIIGRARSGLTDYRLVGAARGMASARHSERAVTAADFRLVATGEPGVEIGRARVSPRVHVVMSLPGPRAQKQPQVIAEAVFVDQKCTRRGGASRAGWNGTTGGVLATP